MKEEKKEVRINSFFLAMLLLVFTLGACADHQLYHQFCPTPISGWAKTDTLLYEFKQINSRLDKVILNIQIRNSTQYPYTDLFVLCQENLSDTLNISSDTIQIKLMTEDGTWKGDGWGYLFQHSLYYKEIRNPQINTNSFLKITPLMQDSILHGIESIGIELIHSGDVLGQHQVSKK